MTADFGLRCLGRKKKIGNKERGERAKRLGICKTKTDISNSDGMG